MSSAFQTQNETNTAYLSMISGYIGMEQMIRAALENDRIFEKYIRKISSYQLISSIESAK